jgi:hypothetical protein
MGHRGNARLHPSGSCEFRQQAHALRDFLDEDPQRGHPEWPQDLPWSFSSTSTMFSPCAINPFFKAIISRARRPVLLAALLACGQARHFKS